MTADVALTELEAKISGGQSKNIINLNSKTKGLLESPFFNLYLSVTVNDQLYTDFCSGLRTTQPSILDRKCISLKNCDLFNYTWSEYR